MATTRASGYVVTHTVWNDVLSRLTDNGVTFSGNVNGGSIAGTTGSFSSTLGVTGVSTFSTIVHLLGGDGGVDATTYGRCLQSVRATSNTGQHLALIRSGSKVWSIGYAYGTSTFAIGDGQATDSNFTAAAASLTITSAGEVQAPLQPGFLARNSSDDTSVATGATVDFDTEVYDDGGDFSGDTFTAPVTGRYLLSASVTLSNVSGAARDVAAYIVTEDGVSDAQEFYIGRVDTLANNDQACLSGSVIANMAASATAKVKIYLDGSTITVLGSGSGVGTDNHYTWFCGRLLP